MSELAEPELEYPDCYIPVQKALLSCYILTVQEPAVELVLVLVLVLPEESMSELAEPELELPEESMSVVYPEVRPVV